MSKRSKKSQSKHDETVARVAGGYKSHGWKVEADLPGSSKPKTIRGHRPDVIARKGKQERVIEVETPKSINSAHAKSQREAFRKWSSENPNRTARTKVTE